MHNTVLTEFADAYKTPPNEGVYVHGLFLDGAGYDIKSSTLIESSNKILYTSMPVIHVTAQNSVPMSKSLYECPLYKKLKRTDLNFIAAFRLKSTAEPVEHWILRGVALLCDIQ